MKNATDETIDLPFITQELIDQIRLIAPDLEDEVSIINYALTYTILTTHLPFDAQTAAPMAMLMAAPKEKRVRGKIIQLAR